MPDAFNRVCWLGFAICGLKPNCEQTLENKMVVNWYIYLSMRRQLRSRMPMPSTIIKPKGSVFKPREVERVITNTMTALAKDIRVDFDVTTQTWDDRPKATIEGSGVSERTIAVEGDLYAMLDKGTKAHDIKPRRKRILRFTGPFRPKTVPNQIASRPGIKGANVIISKHGVRHPGTRPRNWAKTIAAKWRKQAPIVMQRALGAELAR